MIRDVKPKFQILKSILKLSKVVRYVTSKKIYTVNFVSNFTITKVTAFWKFILVSSII